MDVLPKHWVQPLADAGALELGRQVQTIERDALDRERWQLHTRGDDGSVHVFPAFDAVLLAMPAAQAAGVLERSRLAPAFVDRMRQVDVAPCWTLMLAFPQAVQPGLPHIGPQWNAAFSTHHRIAWLARESSKPGRGPVERWTVQASPAWSAEHFEDDPQRVEAKLRKAFAEVTGIRAEPAHTEVKRWRNAKTSTPLGRSHLWDPRLGVGACGDWCLGYRLEHAFVSGLELALATLAP
jgi:predicted NAD/FAD-dependent oxidoreductase